MAASNYEVMKKRMESKFLEYDQEQMIRHYGLRYDADWLYLKFVGRWYCIDRRSGAVGWREQESGKKGPALHPASYNEAMTIYDILCYAREDCCLSGRFCPVNSLEGVVHGSGVGRDLFRPYGEFFDKNSSRLPRACERLGGERQEKGEMTYRIPLFDFLPVILQFWASDEEFPASLNLLWDENILSYMHYETTFFAAHHLMERLKEEL